MSESPTAATDLTSQYSAQVAGDLERNVREQERVTAEIAALQERLTVLQHDHTVLVNMRQALGLASAPAETVAAPEPEPRSQPRPQPEGVDAAATGAAPGGATVPAPRGKSGAEPAAEKPKRTRKVAGRATSGKAAAGKPATPGRSARKPSAAKAEQPKTERRKSGQSESDSATAGRREAEPTKAGQSGTGQPKAEPTKAGQNKAAPTKAARTRAGQNGAGQPKAGPAKAGQPKADGPKLVELVRRHLREQNEPRSAAEIAGALGQALPGRTVKATVVRSTLEGLVARNQAQRSKQGSSVFYTAPDGAEPAPKAGQEARS